MELLQQKFDELRQRLKHSSRISETSDDPLFYLVFPPEKMLMAKRRIKQWTAKLELEGWEVHTFSMAEAVNNIFQNHDLREIWISAEEDDPFDFETINETLRDTLTADDSLQKQLEAKLESLSGKSNTILFVTDLEALHPYLRVGTIEQRLQGRFSVPTVILYPGVRGGKTTLKFLGIYPEDGNYRSTHI